MHVHYFAFGSNMSTARMRERVAEARSLGRGRLDGWRFACNKSGMDGTAKANIVSEPGEVVWGVIFSIPAAALPQLDVFEGGYRRINVEVIDPAVCPLSCETYTSQRLTDQPVPQRWYKQHMLAGAAEHELPADYVAMIAALSERG